MRSHALTNPVRAVDALSSAVHATPSLVKESRALGGLCVCDWRTPWLDGFELPETDELILAYHKGGSHDVRVWNDGALSRVRSTPGFLSMIPPGQRVAYHTGGAVRFTTVHISRWVLKEFLPPGAHEPDHDRFAFRDPFVASCVDSLLREARAADEWTPRFVCAVTEALLLHLLRNAQAEPQQPPESPRLLISRIRARIDSGAATDLSLAALAADAGLSRAHFARVFREIVGSAPHQYVMGKRVEQAKRLLDESDLALSEVAQDAGFCSQSHFTYVFRKFVGVTPQQYRRRQ